MSRKICFEEVTFAYESDSSPVVTKIDLVIPRGSVTALVGTSGSGKSTLADLLLRFYEPDSGRITVDGIDLRELKISSFRKFIAVVSQENFLFNATVRENIRYGNPQATETELIEAARQAYAYNFIQDFPKGFDTVLGDRGVRLSGGQRQRLAIARAIVRKPEILVLDEATSALDSTSEKLVQQALEKVSENRTVLVIAHRLSTIRRADQIVVMDKGRIIEQGKHRELLDLKSYYYRLNKDQSIEADCLGVS